MIEYVISKLRSKSGAVGGVSTAPEWPFTVKGGIYLKKFVGIILPIIFLALLINGCGKKQPSADPPGTGPDSELFKLVGFATLNGGITGGAGGNVTTVSTGDELQKAIDQAMKKHSGQPQIIYVNGKITPANTTKENKINVKDVENISILGVGASGELDGIGIKIWRARNVIIRNLKIHHVNIGDGDSISIEGPASNIWIDHCELYNDFYGQPDKDYYDGLIDIKRESEYITVSWNYLHDSWKTCLVGKEYDTYDRKITFHHNYIRDCNSRVPSYRGGTGHIFNNYYERIKSTGINCRLGATLRIEHNHFKDSNNPIGNWDDPLGYWDVDNSLFTNCTGSQPEESTCTFNPPYDYTPDDVNEVKATVTKYAGVQKSWTWQ